jgi:hypothetical protein
MVAAAVIGSTVVGGLISADAAGDAADTAAGASREASAASIGEQRRQYDLSRADYAPYLAAGTGAVNRLGAGVAAGGEFGAATPFDFRYDQNTDPGYGFSFDQTMRGINASMAAKGMGRSGAGIKGAADLAANLSNRYYGDAFNRYVTGFNANTGERNQLYNRLAGVADKSQIAVRDVTAQGANMAGNIGNAYMTNAANTGNAAMAAAGQRQSAFGGAANMLGRMYGNYGRSPYGGGGGGNENFNIYAPSHAQNLGYAPDAFIGE